MEREVYGRKKIRDEVNCVLVFELGRADADGCGAVIF
jgi:hypothetical protein